MYTGTLDKINTSAVSEIALVCLSETSDYLLGQVNNPLELSVRQVKSYNHILFAFEVATVGATTDDSQNEHYQDHSK